MALQVTIGHASGAFANLAYAKDPLTFRTGHIVSLAFLAFGFLTVSATIMLYKRANALKARKLATVAGNAQYTVREVHELGDKALDFKYML